MHSRFLGYFGVWLREGLFFKESQNPCTDVVSDAKTQLLPRFVEIRWKMCSPALATHFVFTPMKQNHEDQEIQRFWLGGSKFSDFFCSPSDTSRDHNFFQVCVGYDIWFAQKSQKFIFLVLKMGLIK